MARQARIYAEAKDLIYPNDPELYPLIPINGKLYPVDNRISTFNQLKNIQQEDYRKIIEVTMGKAAFEEIEALDLSVAAYKNLIVLIMAAINDMSYDEAKKQMNEAENARFR